MKRRKRKEEHGVVQSQSTRHDQWELKYTKAAMPATRRQLPAALELAAEASSAPFGDDSGGLLTETGGSGGSITSVGSSTGAGGRAGGSEPGGTDRARPPGSAGRIV